MTSQNIDLFSWELRITSMDMIMNDAFGKTKGFTSDVMIVNAVFRYEFDIISIYMKIPKRQVHSEKYSLF
jgi:hypothetical protein